jgi:23S rRNA (uridine2552-2'-O)-methyltransferase
MSRLHDKRQRHDRFYREARKQRYAARSVFKLEQLDRRFRLLRGGRRVLDLGCRPGSWLQYAARRVGPSGFVVGLDRQPLEIALPDNAALVVGDVLELDPEQLRAALPGDGGCFSVVLSDMAPDTTGVSFADQVRSIELFRRALELADRLGCPRSSFVGKLLMGQDFAEVLGDLRRRYQQVKTVRPEATRRSSTEVYLVARGRRGAPAG